MWSSFLSAEKTIFPVVFLRSLAGSCLHSRGNVNGLFSLKKNCGTWDFFFFFSFLCCYLKNHESQNKLVRQQTSTHLQSKRGQHIAWAATKRTFPTIKYAPVRRERFRQVTLASAAKFQRGKNSPFSVGVASWFLDIKKHTKKLKFIWKNFVQMCRINDEWRGGISVRVRRP